MILSKDKLEDYTVKSIEIINNREKLKSDIVIKVDPEKINPEYII